MKNARWVTNSMDTAAGGVGTYPHSPQSCRDTLDQELWEPVCYLAEKMTPAIFAEAVVPPPERNHHDSSKA